MKPTKKKRLDPYAAMRADAVVGGDRDVVLLRPPLSTEQRSVMSPQLAERIGGEPGPVLCTTSSMGSFCGATRRVQVALDECRTISVRAIVAPISPEIGPMIVGFDALRRAKPVMSFAPGRSMSVSCSVPRRRRRKVVDLGWL
ncbi:MAG: hypothetical protein KF773_24670 [Deltaproteobacteria bacterium]|nr:hypothetical protein [Deltaproteobacteria bacterium]